ncbi:hypothetical protein Vafri_934 [Volvox africanus]|nr:hypothetical protein Vafri_934 [Volvox africanus]
MYGYATGYGYGASGYGGGGGGRGYGGGGGRGYGGGGGRGYGGGGAPRSDGGGDDAYQEGKLIFPGLSEHTTKEGLEQYCSQWGQVEECTVAGGEGVVRFSDPTCAQSLLDSEHVIDGAKVEPRAALPRDKAGTGERCQKIFVGGTGDITDEELRNHFSQYGEIQDSVIMRKDGVTRGFGFVTFADPISVEKVLVMRQIIRDKTVDCKRATPREITPSAGGGGGRGGGRGDRGFYGGGYSGSYGGGRGSSGYGRGGAAAAAAGSYEEGISDGMGGYGMSGYGGMAGMAYAPAMAYGGYGGYPMAYGVMGYGGYGRQTMARNSVGQQRFRPY